MTFPLYVYGMTSVRVVMTGWKGVSEMYFNSSVKEVQTGLYGLFTLLLTGLHLEIFRGANDPSCPLLNEALAIMYMYVHMLYQP